MSRKVDVNIYINSQVSDYSNHYNYIFSKRNVSISLSENHAVICYSISTTSRDYESFSFASDIFFDAMRKMYLLHALCFNCGIYPESIKACYDDKEICTDKDTKDFPFIRSLISDGRLDYDYSMFESQNFSFEDEGWNYVIDKLVNSNKSSLLQYRPAVSLYALLKSKNRSTESDRFFNLWTSMNAYYYEFCERFNRFSLLNYEDSFQTIIDNMSDEDKVQCYEEFRVVGVAKKKKSRNAILSNNSLIINCMVDAVKITMSDGITLSSLIWLYDYQPDNTNQLYRYENTDDYEVKKLYTNPYKVFVEKRYEGERLVYSVPLLYELALRDKAHNKNGNGLIIYADGESEQQLFSGLDLTDQMKEKYREIQSIAADYKVSVFSLITWKIAYMWRCNILHGNRVDLLFSAPDEYEIISLITCSYFLERYLQSHIPALFSSDDISRDDFEIMVKYLEQQGVSKGYRVFKKYYGDFYINNRRSDCES